jgi:hypothetical protein
MMARVRRRDRRLRRGRVDVQRGRVDVHQPHVRTQVAHHLGGGGEGVGGGDDLVTRADAQTFQRQVQARGGRIDGDRMQPRLAQEGAEIGFEARRLRPGGDPAGLQRVHHLGDFLVADVGQGEGQEGAGLHCGLKRVFNAVRPRPAPQAADARVA